MILPIIVVFAYFASSVHGKKLHEHMTKEEIESVFNVKHDSIHKLEYDMVRVEHLAERDVYMKSSSQEYRLYLNDNSVFLGSETPIYKTKFNTLDKLSYFNRTFYKDYFPESLKLYHDYKNEAAFAVHTDENNNRHFDGVIGDLHIRSIPARLHKELERNHSAFSEMSPNITNLSQDAFMNNSTYHVIINKSNNSMHDVRNNKEQETKIRPPAHTYETTEHTVYPQIWIVADSHNFELHDRDTKKLAKYIAAFWNAVDLRYRELTHPKVRLNIAGLTIIEDAGPVSNVTETKLPGDYYRHYMLPSDSYDVVVTMTGDPSYYKKEIRKPSGLAYPGRACNYANRDAFVQDDGSFYNVNSATRALGYLFGTDDDPKQTYDECDSIMGYIMSRTYRRHTSFRWSRCSKEAMKAFFNSHDANCLKNKPYVGAQYPKILPGTLLSRDEQCLRRFGVHAESSETYEADCDILRCQPKNEWTIFGFSFRVGMPQKSVPVAEGTSCGMNRICLDGYCVEDSPSYHSTNSQWNQ